jgi:hypothetical protein
MWENRCTVRRRIKEHTMELTAAEIDLFAAYLTDFTTLAGDRRTAHLLGATVQGIIASESLCCSRIAAFSPRPRHRSAR